MTDAERDELLIRLDESTKEIKNKLKTDYAHLHGNGRPGLLDRVQTLEDWQTACQHHYGAVAGAVGFAVSTANSMK